MKIEGLKVITYSNYQNDFYTIDISGSCNLKCLSCAHSIEDHDTPLGLMEYNNFTEVVDKIKVRLRKQVMYLYTVGESHYYIHG